MKVRWKTSKPRATDEQIPSKIEIKRFKDHEIYVRIKEKVRGEDVYIIQSLSDGVNEALMELRMRKIRGAKVLRIE